MHSKAPYEKGISFYQMIFLCELFYIKTTPLNCVMVTIFKWSLILHLIPT